MAYGRCGGRGACRRGRRYRVRSGRLDCHGRLAVGSALPSVNGGPLQAVILRWNGSQWSDDTGGTIPGWLTGAATFPGAAQEWAVGNSSGSTGQILSHS